MTYFVRIQGKTFGPLGLNDMLQLKQRGKLKGFHEVSQNQVDWTSASDYPEFFPSVPSANHYSTPEPAPVAYVAEPVAEPQEPGKLAGSSKAPRQHHRDLYFATLLLAMGLILHFPGMQLQYYSLISPLSFAGGAAGEARGDHIILVMVTIFTLLIMFSLYIISTILCIKAGNAIQAKGLGITSAILTVLALIFSLGSSATLSFGKTLETFRTGLILGTLGVTAYYSAFTTLSFLYHQAFNDLGRKGHGYACHLLGFAWIGILFIFTMSSFAFSFMAGNTEPGMILPFAIFIAMESLGVLQILLLWFLFQTFALRFYLRKSILGQ